MKWNRFLCLLFEHVRKTTRKWFQKCMELKIFANEAITFAVDIIFPITQMNTLNGGQVRTDEFNLIPTKFNYLLCIIFHDPVDFGARIWLHICTIAESGKTKHPKDVLWGIDVKKNDRRYAEEENQKLRTAIRSWIKVSRVFFSSLHSKSNSSTRLIRFFFFHFLQFHRLIQLILWQQ